MEIGESIAQNLKEKCLEDIIEINVTPPGFINFKISQDFFQNKINLIIKNNENYGKGNIGSGKTANVEFVSANPTGPLTVGHGRNAILGDTISKILEWQNFKVTREYYYNDAGRQMRILGKSVEARYYELLGKSFDFPKDGYQGKYINDIAKIVLEKKGEVLNLAMNFLEKLPKKLFLMTLKTL